MAQKVAYEIPSFYFGQLAPNADWSSEASFQFVAVDVGAASGVNVNDGAALVAPASGGAAIGILQNNPQIGEPGTVMVSGVSKAKLIGTVSAGDLLACDAAGKLKVAVSGNYTIAKALMAGVSGDVIAVLLIRNGKV